MLNTGSPRESFPHYAQAPPKSSATTYKSPLKDPWMWYRYRATHTTHLEQKQNSKKSIIARSHIVLPTLNPRLRHLITIQLPVPTRSCLFLIPIQEVPQTNQCLQCLVHLDTDAEHGTTARRARPGTTRQTPSALVPPERGLLRKAGYYRGGIDDQGLTDGLEVEVILLADGRCVGEVYGASEWDLWCLNDPLLAW